MVRILDTELEEVIVDDYEMGSNEIGSFSEVTGKSSKELNNRKGINPATHN
ncbi:hypothetical protein Egran_01989 [Elaphomyces granulatus]|uniref:Uncharacterized protein n=1 Tax=Elaphomyces granulatus TaxID=519963 RepID=A0A232M1F9_9EURO|nr:hypothetical protein Egran_01989 [Elaphomyces granulatus]